MSKNEELNAVVDNTNTRDELTFLELLTEHVFDPSSITEPTEDVHILELSEEPSLVHNNSLIEEDPVIEPVKASKKKNVKASKKDPVTEPVKVEEAETITEPVKVVEEEPVTEPVVVIDDK